jgi:basic membrane protein A
MYPDPATPSGTYKTHSRKGDGEMKTLKKAAAIVISAAMVTGSSVSVFAADPVDTADVKVGFIFVGDEQEGYTEAHMIGRDEMMEELGLSSDQVISKYNIPEDESCYDAAVDLAEQGCQIIFANSFGHEDYMIQAASEYPDVQFCHATGYQAADSGLDNMHNYFTSVYESRYVSGIVAGMKLAEEYGEDTDSKIGYVGAYSYAEVISGMTSFYLGVRSICPNVTMEVKYTGSWADQALEKETAEALIEDGCVLISQHADTTGAAAGCEANGVYDVGYNVSMLEAAPNYALTSASIAWGPYYTEAVSDIINGEDIPVDWCKGYTDGAVSITELSENCAEGTQEAVDAAWAAIADGTLHVFDTSTFTVNGETLTTTATDDLADTYHNVEYISEDGYFMESELASAPAFATIIDGITELNQVY